MYEGLCTKVTFFRCALLGKNGAGKTTLMRILVGELQCDEDKGTVWVHHNLRLAYVAQVRAASVVSFHWGKRLLGNRLTRARAQHCTHTLCATQSRMVTRRIACQSIL